MNSLYITRIILSLGLIVSFCALPTPSKVYSYYSYHCIKNSCLALIEEYKSPEQAMRYVVRLNTTVAYKVLHDLIKEGKVPAKYGYEINN